MSAFPKTQKEVQNGYYSQACRGTADPPGTGEGGGGFGGLGGSDGKYEVKNFVLAENFEMPNVEAVNVYQMLDGDQETRKDSMIALIEDYFDAKYNEQEDTFTTADGSMTDMLVWANGVYIYHEKSSEQTKQFRQDYQSYSLRKTEKQGLKVAKEFSEKLSAALGQSFSYVESYEKTVYLSTAQTQELKYPFRPLLLLLP